MDVHTLVVTASLGEFDKPQEHQEQSVDCDFTIYTDENFPQRYNAMTSRTQAKIPKCFAWQMRPGYESYLWLDGNIRLQTSDAVQYFQEQLKGHDIVVFHHPDRDTIYWEYRYNWRALNNNAPSNYMVKRYTNEHLDEQYEVIKNDKDYKDDALFNGGVFMYRNTPEVQNLLKEWWYHITRYCVMDQLSWTYLLKKSGLNIKVLHENIGACEWVGIERHAK